MTIPHPDGSGRQQPSPDDYTISAARIANATGDAVVIDTVQSGSVLIGRADTPALFEKFLLWAQQPGNSAEAYVAPAVEEPRPSEVETLKAALIAKGTLTEAEIDAARTTTPERKG